MEIKSMAAVASAGMNNEIKEQCEKHEKFVGHFFFFSKKRKPVLKEKKRYEKGMAKKGIKS